MSVRSRRIYFSKVNSLAHHQNVLLALQNMKDKRENVESFAQFAKNYQQYKKNTLQYQQRVEYIKSLYEVEALNMTLRLMDMSGSANQHAQTGHTTLCTASFI